MSGASEFYYSVALVYQFCFIFYIANEEDKRWKNDCDIIYT